MDRNMQLIDAFLSGASKALKLSRSPITGVISGWKLHDGEGRYLFAWQHNQHHILFYLRHPALNVYPKLKSIPLGEGAYGSVNRNPSDEITTRVETMAQAEKLIEFASDAIA